MELDTDICHAHDAGSASVYGGAAHTAWYAAWEAVAHGGQALDPAAAGRQAHHAAYHAAMDALRYGQGGPRDHRTAYRAALAAVHARQPRT